MGFTGAQKGLMRKFLGPYGKCKTRRVMVLKAALAASIYLIWGESNNRVFKKISKDILTK